MMSGKRCDVNTDEGGGLDDVIANNNAPESNLVIIWLLSK